jgi:hypothetical protein
LEAVEQAAKVMVLLELQVLEVVVVEQVEVCIVEEQVVVA